MNMGAAMAPAACESISRAVRGCVRAGEEGVGVVAGEWGGGGREGGGGVGGVLLAGGVGNRAGEGDYSAWVPVKLTE